MSWLLFSCDFHLPVKRLQRERLVPSLFLSFRVLQEWAGQRWAGQQWAEQQWVELPEVSVWFYCFILALVGSQVQL